MHESTLASPPSSMNSSPHPPSFQDTLLAAQAGDKAAINQLFTDYYPRVRQLVHRSLETDLRQGRNWLMARFSTGDVVQEVFWSVLGSLEDVAGKTEKAFIGYLAMVVRNRIIDALRYHEAEKRDGRQSSAELKEGQHSADDVLPIEHAIIAENAERCQAALLTLNERERLLLRARFEESATFEELAEQLGYSHEAATRRAFYSSMAKLSLMLNPDGKEDES